MDSNGFQWVQGGFKWIQDGFKWISMDCIGFHGACIIVVPMIFVSNDNVWYHYTSLYD